MKSLLIAAGMAAALAAALPAAAQGVNARQMNQDARIGAGVATGQLSRGEAHRLHAQQRRIAYAERRMRARNGGHLTPRQRMMLERRQDRASAEIHALKHNGRTR